MDFDFVELAPFGVMALSGIMGVFFRMHRLACSLVFVSIGLGLANGRIDLIGILGLLVVLGLSIVALRNNQENRKEVAWGIWPVILVLAVAPFLLHLFPGFNNLKVFDQVKLSPSSAPFTMYLNLDSTAAAMILYLTIIVMRQERLPRSNTVRMRLSILAGIVLLAMVLIFSSVSLLGFISMEVKSDLSLLVLWAANNLLMTCMAEEVFFRGFIQNEIESRLDKKFAGSASAWAALVLTSFVFAAAHFRGGIALVVAAFVAGMLYGFVYLKTRDIRASIVTHFLFNLVHIVLFTYPSQEKI